MGALDEAGNASPTGAPHALQKRAIALSSCPQREQILVSLAPHCSQKFDPAAFSKPQSAQRISPLDFPGSLRLNADSIAASRQLMWGHPATTTASGQETGASSSAPSRLSCASMACVTSHTSALVHSLTGVTPMSSPPRQNRVDTPSRASACEPLLAAASGCSSPLIHARVAALSPLARW